MEAYRTLETIGEGSFGVVVKARNLLDGDIVAIKTCKPKLCHTNSIKTACIGGLPYSVLRETALLKTLTHINIVTLKTVWVDDYKIGSISLVFDYYPMTLHQYIQSWEGEQIPNKVTFKIFHQLTLALHFAHSKHIAHRDLKPQNIMLTSDMVVKVGDFGLARQLGYPFSSYTKEIVTLWYRAPEILLESNNYDISVDMWSMGCILAEILMGHPIFAGNDVVEQLIAITGMLGPIDETEWPDVVNTLKWQYIRFPCAVQERLIHRCSLLQGPFFSILDRLLVYCPHKRLNTISLLERLDLCK